MKIKTILVKEVHTEKVNLWDYIITFEDNEILMFTSYWQGYTKEELSTIEVLKYGYRYVVKIGEDLLQVDRYVNPVTYKTL